MKLAALFLSLLSIAEANTDVRQPPILLETAPQDLDPYWPTSGLSITLPCVAEGIPEPEYQWKKDGATFDINDETVTSRGYGGTITLDGTMEIGGYYQCIASNEWGKALSNNTYLPRAHLDTISIPPYDVAKKEGEGLRLPCSHVTVSIPEPSYSWILVNDVNTNEKKRLLETSRLLIGVIGDLFITNLQPEDQQDGYTYKCQVRNGHMGTTVEGSPAKITVIPEPVPNYVPKILTGKREYLGLVGEDVSIDCVFESSPEEHQVFWNQLNVPPERAEKSKYNTRFTIKAVEAGDRGTYQCWASNTQGISERINIVLTVESKPTFIPGGELRNLEVVQGENAKFTCLNKGTPTPEVQWSINGNPLDNQEPGPRRRYEDNGQSLVITNACKEAPRYCTTPDLFTVHCKVTNTHGYLYRGAALNVLLPTIVMVQPKKVVVNSTTNIVVFTCTAVTDPLLQLSFKWIHNGEQLYNDTNHVVSIWPDNSLHLNYTLADDEFKEGLLGDFTCQAESGQFGGSDTAVIELEKAQESRHPPMLTKSAPQELEPYWPIVGVSLTIPCVAWGIPDPEYRWKKDGAPFEVNDATVISQGEGGTITLDGTKEIGGHYQCVASNKWGKAFSNNTYLPRARLVTISKPLYEVTKKQGEGLRLPCNHVTVSIPEPTYSWILVSDLNSFEKKTIIENSRFVVGISGMLYITNLLPDDQRDGYTYKCRARNGNTGTTVEGSPAKITVIREPVPSYVPKIISGKRKYLGLVGEDVWIDCVFESFPEEHQVFWNQLNVPPERVLKSKQDTRFMIKAVETRDAGTYQCWASNGKGTSERTNIVLVVESKPTFIPGEELQNLEVVQGQDVKFTCLNKGTPNPTVQWSINGDDLDKYEPGPLRRYENHGQSLVITNACKEAPQYCTTPDLFTVQCNVTNTHGYLYRGAALNVLLPTRVTVHPKKVLLNSSTDIIVFTCTAVTDPTLQLSYKWIHSEDILYNDTNHVVSIWSDNSLHIDYALADDELKKRLLGDYKCVAESGHFSGSDTALFEIEKVQEPRHPPILTNSAPQELDPYWPKICLSFTLPCIAWGIPDPGYLWYRNGAPFDINEATVVSRGEGGTITLDGTKEIQGYYQCVASNQWGRAISNNTYLPRARMETISRPLYEVAKKQGEGLQLVCDHVAVSIPESTYSWVLVNDLDSNERKTLMESSRLLIGVTGCLYITNLQQDDQQDGYTYKCQARNGNVGTMVEGSPAKITVIPEPVPNNVPKILSGKREYLGLVGEDVSIDCIFESFSKEPQIFWNLLNIPPERAQHSKYDTRFTIKAVESGDAGTYQCWASNAQGISDRTDIMLIVESKPTFIPGGELKNLEVVQGENAKFMCLNKGTPTPEVQWFINGDPLDKQEPGPRKHYEDNGQSLVIINACKEAPVFCATPDLFTVQCKVSNVHGYLFQGAALNVLLPTHLVVLPQDVIVNSNTTTK